MHLNLPLCVVWVLLYGCTSTPARVASLYGGAGGFDLLHHHDRAEVFRITDRARLKPGTPVKGELHRWAILEGPDPLAADAARRLADVLSEDIYEWDSAKGCKIMPGLAARFVRGDRRLEVVFCFECDILAVYLDGQAVGSEDFDRAHRRLAALAREWFPLDAEIQKLGQ